MIFSFVVTILKSIFCFLIFNSKDFCKSADEGTFGQEECEAIVVTFPNGEVVPSAALFLGTVPEGTVSMEVDPTTTTVADTQMNLYDEAGAYLANNDDYAGVTWSGLEQSLMPGTYVLAVSSYSVDPLLVSGSPPFVIGSGSSMFDPNVSGTIGMTINTGVLSGSLQLGDTPTTDLPELGVYCFNVA